jgi:hypothetical protein
MMMVMVTISASINKTASPPGGYVGGGLQMQTDLAIDPAGNVWVMNNWQDIDSCFGTPPESLSTRCGDGKLCTLASKCPLWSLADMLGCMKSVRFTPESRHSGRWWK